MIQDDYYRNYCVVIVGDMLVGKTDLLNRLLGKGFKGLIDVGEYSEKRKLETEKNGEFLISYNECPSGKSYEKKNEKLYKIGEGFIITFDISDEDTFNNIDKYIKLIKENSPKVSFIALIGNKIDLINKMKVSDEDMCKKLEEIKKIFYGKRVVFRTVSAKTNDGIEELEIDILEEAKKKNRKEKELREYSGFEII